MLNELSSLINLEQFNNVFILVVQLIIAAITYYYNATYKSALDKEIEKYKHRLHVEYLKAEVKTKQLFNIYPTLFAHLKETEAEIFWLKSCNAKKDGPSIKEKVPFLDTAIKPDSYQSTENMHEHCINALCDNKKAKETFIKANNYCMYKLVFLSEEVAKLSLEICELMKDCLYCHSEILEGSWKKLKNQIERLENQIRKELSNSERKIEQS